MDKHAVWVTMEAKPGKADDAHAFLEEVARRLADEPGTTRFFAMELGDDRFAVFSTFRDDAALAAHGEGPVGRWIEDQQTRLFVAAYRVTRSTLLPFKK